MEHRVPLSLSQTPKESHKNTPIVIWKIFTLFRRIGGAEQGKGLSRKREGSSPDHKIINIKISSCEDWLSKILCRSPYTI